MVVKAVITNNREENSILLIECSRLFRMGNLLLLLINTALNLNAGQSAEVLLTFKVNRDAFGT
jgi:hypothetical protein